MKRHIIWKLLLINLVVIAFVLVILWFAIDYLAADYFMTLMEKYNISPKPAHAMFVDAVHRYLLWACIAAVMIASVLSFLMMRRVLAPLTRMTVITRQIAAGDFAGRVPLAASDEVGQLAAAFNRMAESLESIENLRRGLMIDVAHELRTPLTNMRGYLEALKDGVLPPTGETITLLHRETLQLVDLVEDVLQLARADAARGSLEYRPVDLPVLVEEIRSTFSARLADRQITVSLDFPESIPPVLADRDRISRVFRNLLDNAVRYTPIGGSLEIRGVTAGDRVEIALVNPVDELRPEDLPFIFERFYRGEKSRSREHGGAGIGLAIVKELVEAHGGRVGAGMSENRVRIWFDLPMSPLPPDPNPA